MTTNQTKYLLHLRLRPQSDGSRIPIFIERDRNVKEVLLKSYVVYNAIQDDDEESSTPYDQIGVDIPWLSHIINNNPHNHYLPVFCGHFLGKQIYVEHPNWTIETSGSIPKSFDCQLFHMYNPHDEPLPQVVASAEIVCVHLIFEITEESLV